MSLSQTVIKGEYYFHMQEMIAGFDFSDDGKFWFYYSYGAVDRNATGRFSISNDMIHLESDKNAGNDFSITGQKKQGSGYTLIFSHTNSYLLKEIRCIFYANGETREVYTDGQGKAYIELADCETICVQHSLYPDIVTFIKDQNSDSNYFTLTLNVSLEQVSFKGISLKIEDENKISCPHNYFIEIPDIKFIKQSNKTNLS